jgi:hypothetical protein
VTSAAGTGALAHTSKRGASIDKRFSKHVFGGVNVAVSGIIDVGWGGDLKVEDDCFRVAEAISLEPDGDACLASRCSRCVGAAITTLA